MIIPPFTFSWKAYNRPFIVGYFVVNYPVCDSIACYMYLLAVKAISFQLNLF